MNTIKKRLDEYRRKKEEQIKNVKYCQNENCGYEFKAGDLKQPTGRGVICEKCFAEKFVEAVEKYPIYGIGDLVFTL